MGTNHLSCCGIIVVVLVAVVPRGRSRGIVIDAPVLYLEFVSAHGVSRGGFRRLSSRRWGQQINRSVKESALERVDTLSTRGSAIVAARAIKLPGQIGYLTGASLEDFGIVVALVVGGSGELTSTRTRDTIEFAGNTTIDGGFLERVPVTRSDHRMAGALARLFVIVLDGRYADSNRIGVLFVFPPGIIIVAVLPLSRLLNFFQFFDHRGKDVFG
mmetsp:Transcript_24769/g.54364  ORF Transcript_24769/g.54364 Transcript_24769/m.54364 type:complete len:215 (+) Transcript_24769:672-1316(+)